MSHGEPTHPLSVDVSINEVDVEDGNDMEMDSDYEVGNDATGGDNEVNAPIAVEEEVEKKSKGGRRQSSEVWQYFKRFETMKDGKLVKMAKCLHCTNGTYTLVSFGSTSHLKRHVKSCYKIRLLKGEVVKGTLKFQGSNQVDYEVARESGGYDQMKCREIMAKMIIAHELPFMFVEYQWFNILMKYNNPLYQKVSRNTIKNDCIRIFEFEKEKIKKNFKRAKMISLTTDCWTSNQTVGYICLTAHYIDSDWKLQKRIISFYELEPPHTGEVIADAITESLMKWNILNKVGTITLDNASSNDRVATILRSNLEERGLLHFDGLFFHVRCCAHILNLIVQDGIGKIEGCIAKIRDSVKYLRKSPARLFRFGEIAIQLGLSTRRSLCSDVKTRWNSTHRMLQSAIYYKSTYQRYAMRDSNFVWLPSEEEWARAEVVVKLLDIFTKASELFSGTLYPTSNLYFNEVFKVKKIICEAYQSDDVFMKEMSQAMFAKFEKYWGDVSLLMAIASILDPRFKLNLIEYCYNKLYSSDIKERIDEVKSKLGALFEKYKKKYKASNSSSASSLNSVGNVAVDNNQTEDDYFSYIMESQTEDVSKSDLEVYLEEKILVVGKGDKFDVLEWWKVNCVKFPILSLLARDILSIPISTVASESAFSAGGRVLDDYRSSLTKDMVELLVCGGDWIRASSSVTFYTLQEAARSEENLEVQVPDAISVT